MKAAQQRGLMPSTGLGVGILASLLLGLLTLSVFYVLQDYGPESAIRKYNEAVLKGDPMAIDQISAQSYTSPAGQWLYSVVRNSLAQDGRLRLDQLIRRPSAALAVVEYVSPGRRVEPLTILVTKENHVWKVNPLATYQLYSRGTGAG